MGISTFGSFTQARLAIYASQSGISVTGNNIANINTTGYTRQRLDLESFRAGGADRYQSSYSLRIGNGVLTTGVSQLRDPYLDIRYRSEMSSVGALDTKLGGLENIQSILDEVGDGEDDFGILEAQFNDLYDALQQLSNATGEMEYDIQVRSSAESLVKQIKSYSSRLEEVYNNAMTAYEQDVAAVNSILSNIRDLNASIRKNEIHGDSALELKDERNQLLDQLSEYMKIDIIYEKEDIGAGQSVDKLVVKLANANPDSNVTTDSSTLVDGIYATQFEVTEQIPQVNPNYDPKETNTTEDTFGQYLKADGTGTNDEKNAKMLDNENLQLTMSALTNSKGKVLAGSDKILLDDNDLYGALQSERELLTESGEFTSQDTIDNVDENAATKRGIPYYQKSLDLLANQFAKAFNEANQGYIYNENGEYLQLKDNGDGTYENLGTISVNVNGTDVALKKTDTWDSLDTATQDAIKAEGCNSIEAYLAKKGGVMLGTPLFSTRSDNNETEGITASNISISLNWSKGQQIVSSFQLPTGMTSIPTTESSNISHMVNLFSQKMDYNPNDVFGSSMDNVMFTGTFQEMFTNMNSVLGNDIKVTTTMLDSHYASSVSLDSSRASNSSVDLNDEAMNLMQYTQSYNAACRLMTTIDSLLDKLVNGT